MIYARADRELLRAIDERVAQESDRFGARLTRSDVVRAILTRVLLPRD